jgi:hypothetical protein
MNDELKSINVIKPKNIIEIVNAYKEALRTWVQMQLKVMVLILV